MSTVITTQRSSEVAFAVDSSETPLPAWGAWLHDLGHATGIDSEAPRTVAVSAPTRSYAALLVTLGVVRGRCHMPPGETDHFEALWQAAISTSPDVTYAVRFLEGGKEYRGMLGGCDTSNGVRRIVVTQGKFGRVTIPEPYAKGKILAFETKEVRTRAGRTVSIRDPWLATVLDGCDSNNYHFHSRHDCLLIGTESALEAEARLELFMRSPDRSKLRGQVKDVLRFQDHKTGSRSFNCAVLPQVNEVTDLEETEIENLKRFHTVVFDGPRAYLRWRGALAEQHHIAILDRTATNGYADAVAAVNETLVQRVGKLEDSISLRSPPALEAVAFRRRA